MKKPNRLDTFGLFSLVICSLISAAPCAFANYPPPPSPGAATFGGLGYLNYPAGRLLSYISADGGMFVGWEDYLSDDGLGGGRAFAWSEATGLVPLMLPGGTYSYPSGVSADGSTVIGSGDVLVNGSSQQHAFVWTVEEGMQDLGTLPGGTYSYPSGISADGSAVVGVADVLVNGNAQQRAFVWTVTGGMQALGTLPGGTYSSSSSVSANGSTVVGAAEVLVNGSLRQHAFVWTVKEGMQDLGTLPGGSRTDPSNMSADGSTVVGYGDVLVNGSQQGHAFVWTVAGGMQDLGTLPGGTYSSSSSVSANGSIVIGRSQTLNNGSYEEHAFVWTAAGGIQDLGTLPGGTYSYASSVSADGTSVIGYSFVLPNGSASHAFVWTAAGGIQDLGTLPGGTYSYATSVSADGSAVIGIANKLVNGSQQQHTFLWTTAGGMQDLGVLPDGADSYPSGISADGSTVIGSGGVLLNGIQLTHAFVWTRANGLRDFGAPVLSVRPQPLQVYDSGNAAGGIVTPSFGLSGRQERAVVWKSTEHPTELLLPGGTYSAEHGVSANGSAVIGSADVLVNGSLQQHGFVWTVEEGMQDLGALPGGTYSYPSGVSADGSTVIGGANVDGSPQQHVFVWTGAAGLEDLGTLPGGNNSSPAGVSANGSTVIGTSEMLVNGNPEPHAFIWTRAGGMQVLTLPDSINSSASRVSGNGSTIIGSATVIVGGSQQQHAFVWNVVGGMQDLTLPGGTFSFASSVSANGSTVFGTSSVFADGGQQQHAFVWTAAGGIQDLTLPGGTYSYISSVSQDGAIAVGSANVLVNGSLQQHAFMWIAPGGLRDLGMLAGGANSSSTSISADGSTVIGEVDLVINGNHQSHAFVWTAGEGMQDLGTLPGGIYSSASRVSANGSTVIGTSDRLVNGIQEQHAFVWTKAGGMQDFGIHFGHVGPIQGMSLNGKIVVGMSGEVEQTALIWIEGKGLRPLKQALSEDWHIETSTWQLKTISMISSNGLTFGGMGKNPDGQLEGWAVRLGTEAMNPLPIANAQSLTTAEDTALAITLTAADAEGATLSYSILTGPDHGALTGTIPNLTYHPFYGYNGLDQFSFAVNDGEQNSAPAIVSITVNPVNDLPIAGPVAIEVVEDTPSTILLSGIDDEASGFGQLHSFSGTDGLTVRNGLILASDGFLYGTTYVGGNANLGVIYRMAKDGTGFAMLHDFSSSTGGTAPVAGVMEGSDGLLYGTTSTGGTHGRGVVYRIGRDGSEYQVLRNFGDGADDGGNPAGSLTEMADGKIYGVTSGGGANEGGTVFRLNRDGSGYEILRRFDGAIGAREPQGGVRAGSDGMLYGTAGKGGSGGGGAVFRLNPDGTGYEEIWQFGLNATDGRLPVGELHQSSDGMLYGTTSAGGSDDAGTIYRLNRDGTGYELLRSFKISGWDGWLLLAGLMESSDGKLYGTAHFGGSGGAGTLFRLNRDGGGFEVLRGFRGVDGGNPQCTLVEDQNGRLYGTTLRGGHAVAGTVFTLLRNSEPLTFTITQAPAHGTFLQSGAHGTYTSAANYNGPDSIWFKVNDGTADSFQNAIIINVTPVKDAPVVGNYSWDATEDAATEIILTGYDPDGNSLVFSIITPPEHGLLSGSPPNLTYTPAENYHGPDRFTYRANNGTLNSDVGTISIFVNPVNDPPVANDDTYTTDQNTILSVATPGLLGNDTDVDEGPLPRFEFAGWVWPPSGDPDFTYGQRFTGFYEIDPAGPFHDPLDNTVRREYVCENASWELGFPDRGYIFRGSGVLVDVGNDTAFGDRYIVTFYNGGNVGSAQPSGRQFSLAQLDLTDGVSHLAHMLTDETIQSTTVPLAAAQNSAGRFLFRDNSQPSLIFDALVGPKKVTKVNGTEIGTTTLTELASGARLVVHPNGSLRYDPNGRFAYLPSGVTAVDTFTYEVTDREGATATATGTITVVGINDAPVVGDYSWAASEDTATELTLTGYDVDGDSLVFSVITPPAHGLLSGLPPNLIYAPNANYNGPDQFTYQANDGLLDSEVRTISIFVSPVNDPPVPHNEAYATDERTVLNVSQPGLLANETDIDAGPLTTFKFSGHMTASDLDFADGESFTGFYTLDPTVVPNATLDATVRWDYNSPNGLSEMYFDSGYYFGGLNTDIAVGNDTAFGDRYIVSFGGAYTIGRPLDSFRELSLIQFDLLDRIAAGADMLNDESIQSTTVNLAAAQEANGRIVFTDGSQVTLALDRLDGPFTITQVNGNTADVNRVITLPSGAKLRVNANGSFSYDPNGQFKQLAAGATATDSFIYEVSDNDGGKATATATITITGLNDAPVVANRVPNQSAVYGTAFNFVLPANTISDADAAQLTYQASGMPPGISFNAATRNFSGAPTTLGTFTITLIATDDASPPLSASTTFDVVVGKAPLIIAAVNKTKVYGAVLPVLTASYLGFVNGDTMASLSQVPTLSTTAKKSSTVGDYPVTLAGGAAANYQITLVDGLLSVTRAPLTITAVDKSNVYGTALPALTATYAGFVNGDGKADLDVPVTLFTTASTVGNAGTYPIIASGAADANYAITFVPGTLTISPALLTVKAQNQTKVYGEALPSLAYTFTGFALGDAEGSLNTPVTITTTATPASGVGNYPVTVSGASSPNYTVKFVDGTLKVTKASLTITADDKTRPVGQANPPLTASYLGFVNGDTAASLDTPVSLITTAKATSPAGTYPIKASAAKGANYTITFVNGILRVTP